MFSYRHGFHAGNHADVLKHVVLVQLLAHLRAKDKPFWVVDTHAGAGAYPLQEGFAAKSGEYETGVARLWPRAWSAAAGSTPTAWSAQAADDASLQGRPAALRDYLALIRAFNGDGPLTRYPGSPEIARQMLRSDDRLRLFEAHTTEIDVLRAHFASAGRQVAVQAGDGFALLKSVLPPPPRRGLVLIDPSYEDKADYRKVVATMREALQRFATGVYAIWYPQVQRRESHALPEQLERLAGSDWLHATLTVKTPAADGLGLHGSGVFVFNPPWRLEAALSDVLPVLAERLSQDDQARFTLDFRQR